jgi:APA family basic amino acid/polyamine antiporter
MFVTLNGTASRAAERIPFAVSATAISSSRWLKCIRAFLTPGLALIVQCVMALLFYWEADHSETSGAGDFLEWLFLHDRRQHHLRLHAVGSPNAPRPYRTWGYPVVPALFVVAAAVLLYPTLMGEAASISSQGLV